MTEDVIGELGAELGIDPERLAVLRGCSPTEQRAFADAVACTRHDQAAELDAALRRAVRMGAAVLPLLTALDEQHVAALGGVPELADRTPGPGSPARRTCRPASSTPCSTPCVAASRYPRLYRVILRV